MGKKGRKRRKSSDDSPDKGKSEKREKWNDSHEDESTGERDLSDVLSQVNSVLYESVLVNPEDGSSILDRFFDVDDQTSNLSLNEGGVNKMATAETNKNNQPSNADIMTCLSVIEGKLNTIDERLNKQTSTLDSVKQKMGSFESELRNMWKEIHENEKQTDLRLHRVEESTEAADFNLQMLTDKMSDLQKKEEQMTKEMLYLQSQSMRNNLVFKNICEERNDASVEDIESKVRQFLAEKMKLSQDLVSNMKFDRVHRMGQKRDGLNRHVVAKFTSFKERELVRKQSGILKGTNFAVFEQFPREINEKRQRLLPQMREEKRKGNKAWISYDTLYVNGRPTKTTTTNNNNS